MDEKIVQVFTSLYEEKPYDGYCITVDDFFERVVVDWLVGNPHEFNEFLVLCKKGEDLSEYTWFEGLECPANIDSFIEEYKEYLLYSYKVPFGAGLMGYLPPNSYTWFGEYDSSTEMQKFLFGEQLVYSPMPLPWEVNDGMYKTDKAMTPKEFFDNLDSKLRTAYYTYSAGWYDTALDQFEEYLWNYKWILEDPFHTEGGSGVQILDEPSTWTDE